MAGSACSEVGGLLCGPASAYHRAGRSTRGAPGRIPATKSGNRSCGWSIPYRSCRPAWDHWARMKSSLCLPCYCAVSLQRAGRHWSLGSNSSGSSAADGRTDLRDPRRAKCRSEAHGCGPWSGSARRDGPPGTYIHRIGFHGADHRRWR